MRFYPCRVRRSSYWSTCPPPVSADIRVRCANRTDSSTQNQRYHLLSAAALNSSRNRNFVHMKGETQREILGQATPGTAAGGCWTGEAVPMTTPGTAASRCNFLLKSLRPWRPLRPASWQVLARRERAAAGRGTPIADCPKSASRSRPSTATVGRWLMRKPDRHRQDRFCSYFNRRRHQQPSAQLSRRRLSRTACPACSGIAMSA